MKPYALLFVLALGLAACDKTSSPDGTKARAGAESEAQRDVDNQNQAAKAEKMEKDLSQRHFFYSAMGGQYEGSVKVGRDTYGFKVTLTKSLAPYSGDRVRQLSEIESDLNNLYFNAQVIQWYPTDPSSAVGCRVGQLRPDMVNGVLTIASSDCPNVYKIYLANGGIRAFEDREPNARSLAISLSKKEIEQVPELVGTIQPTMNANTYTFTAKRMK